MNGASKILTVSYGTFSCTLEGFDDPFNTMKAIAEYFRDLAAEDRYFGAEPPTPDAAMLHRIAEREIQRRVEAKIQENGVVLRASDSLPDTPAVAAPLVAEAPRPVVADAVAPAAAPAETPTVAAPAVAAADAPKTESVVEKLSRLRSEVAAQPSVAAPVATMPVVSFAIPDYLEDEDTGMPEAGPGLPEAFDADVFEAEAFDPQDAVEAAVEADVLATDIAAEDEAEPVALAPDSLDALLATVEEAVADAPQPEPVAETPSEDLTDPMMAALADTLAGTEADVVPEAAAEEIALPEVEEISLAALDEVIAAETAVPDVAAVEEDAILSVLTAEEASVAAAPAETTAHDLADDGAAFDQGQDLETAQDAALEAAFVHDATELAEDVAPQDADAADDAAQSAGLELRPGAAEKLQRARARVIRIRKVEEEAPGQPVVALDGAEPEAPVVAEAESLADLVDEPVVAAAAPAAVEIVPEADAIAADSFEASLSDIFAEVEVTEAEAPKPQAVKAEAEVQPEGEASPEALLSAEDEAELMRELAALRSHDEDGSGAADVASAFVLQQDARKGFEGPSADEALGRLMKQTDNEMEGPENKRRQSAIAHLKAAVAATVAERKVTGDKPSDTAGVSRLARYRNDLAMVVKSALPGRSAGEAAKDRPAPLVLVSEQRIDRPIPAPSAAPAPTVVPQSAPAAIGAPIRPRRVTASGLAMQAADDDLYDEDETAESDVTNLFGDAKGFGDFVERVGAVTLEQILEASAAYLAAVEGRPHFSRPQLMHHLGAVVPAGTYQREDSLRGFGTLLRKGRISKLRRGQFVLSEESPYLAEAKKIAG